MAGLTDCALCAACCIAGSAFQSQWAWACMQRSAVALHRIRSSAASYGVLFVCRVLPRPRSKVVQTENNDRSNYCA
jgi:hypothetical protein